MDDDAQRHRWYIMLGLQFMMLISAFEKTEGVERMESARRHDPATAAASALGQDPRTPGNVVIAQQPLSNPALHGVPTVAEQWIARIAYGLEQYMVQNMGVDFTNAPPAPTFASQGGAPSITPSAPSVATSAISSSKTLSKRPSLPATTRSPG